MARDGHLSRVVLLSEDLSARERWRAELTGQATIVADLRAQDVDPAILAEAAVLGDIFITDSAAISQSLAKAKCGSILVGYANDSYADVNLSTDYTARELQLVVPLLGDIARFRASHGLMVQTVRQAQIDFVTGLFNRAAWESQRQVLAKAIFPACIALLDLDNFKVCNDRVNWTFGDNVLQAVAEVISQSMQRQDIAARWGGDEFALVFARTGMGDVAPRIEQLRSAIGALRFTVQPEVTISASVGYAALPSAEKFDTAFAACQTALREAKTAGGNAARLG